MKPDRWEILSGWLAEWLAADAPERERLRAALAAAHPELVADAERLASASLRAGSFLETPALLLAARDVALDDPPLTAGSMVGPYRVATLLARGGMGEVYRATDVRLQRDVAVKVLAQTRTGDATRVERFMHEARVTASLDHPNVVRVFDVGTLADRAYLVAELLEGETLRCTIDRGAMRAGDVLRIAREIANGLAAAHAAGLVHRDLKPENIFLTQSGTTKLLDFGIAKLTQDESVRDGFSTLTGVVLGTAGYLAPEQVRGETVDARADLFALGVVLFEMLTGTRAFARNHLVETLHAILHDPPSDALEQRSDVPRELVEIVRRLLEKSPDARFQSSADVIAALDGVDVARVPSRVRRWKPRSKRRPTVRTLRWAGVTLVLAIAATVAIVRPWSDPPIVTLAVMPFQSIPATNDADMLELGLADVFISRLGQLPDVRVLPLSATERMRGTDPRAAARQLGATHVLSVRLQRDGGIMRATPQLFSLADGRMVWSTNVDADVTSVFSIQDIVVTRVVEELAPRLATGAQRRIAQPGTRNNDAYAAYLRGRSHVRRPTTPDQKTAIAHFKEAVALDPGYADGWSGLANAHRRLPVIADEDPALWFPQAKRAATRALELDPDNGEAHSVLGSVAVWHEWDYPRGERLMRRAAELQPNSPDVQILLAHLLSNIGRHDEALVEARRARALDPDWLVSQALEGQFLFMARRYDDSLERLDTVVGIDPTFWTPQTMRVYPLIALGRHDEAIRGCERVLELRRDLDSATGPFMWVVGLKGYSLARLGRTADAEAMLEWLRAEARRRYVPPYNEALLLHALGRDDEALNVLRAAVEQRAVLQFLGVDPKWDELRGDPAFRAILARINLLEVSDAIRR